jgi:tetratricopeptide (TPR) repeat protein
MLMKTVVGVLAALLLLTLLGTPSAEADALDIEKTFREGIALAKEGKHAEALVLYEKILVEAPDATGVLYNAGLAAYMCGKYEVGAKHWKRLKTLDPNDWQVRSKLVQAYQALGKKELRDKEIKDLHKLRKDSEDEELKKMESFCRDQFVVGERRVYAYEHYELVGERAVKFWFGVYDEKGEKEYSLSLGSYEYMTRMMREVGQLEEDQRAYHLDGYWPERHATYRFYKSQPDYDELKVLIVGIVKGEIKPMSSSRLGPPKTDDESETGTGTQTED